MMTGAAEVDAGAGVSVALCTRNGARYIAAQVESICAQDLLPREIVVSDDASTDDTIAIVRETIARCGKADVIDLTVLRNDPPLGVTRNFEQAIEATRCTLIALCDQDDVWHAGRLARMVEPFRRRPDLLLLHSDAHLVDDALVPLGSTLFKALEAKPSELAAIQAGEAFETLLRRNLVTGATTVFRRSLLGAALPFPAEWVHDEWLAAIASATGRMDVLIEPLIDYRQHATNQIGVQKPTLADKIAKAVAPRGDKHRKRLGRAEALLQRLKSLSEKVPQAHLQAQLGKVAH
ncbi:MAG: glycosyl transferase family 2, partial [Variovorax sp.]|nr:glycosyl transferase family 2 [Variovorax sp.]